MKGRSLLVSAFVLWLALVLAAFFTVQKPAFLAVVGGIASLAGTILLTVLLILAAGSVGYRLVSRAIPDSETTNRLVFSIGLGMGALGLLGFGLAAMGQARQTILLGILGVSVWAGWRGGQLSLLAANLRSILGELRESAAGAPKWVKWLAAITFCLTLILALAPPVEAFDGLSYHLVMPSWWLRDGGLRVVDLPQYWFPSLMEGIFVWPMAFGKDSIPQLLHLLFGTLSVLLVWDWAKRLWGGRVAWWTMAIVLSMPSLPWLAAWAYTDLALVFYSLCALMALWKYMQEEDSRWLMLSGAMTGLAMGLKYTSIALPIAEITLLVWQRTRPLRGLVGRMARHLGVAALLASPWYLRNWILVGNPFYPFVFGGRYWDSFRAQWLAQAGTGTGWNPLAVLSVPFITTLGYRDANYFDGRIGPFYLLLVPFTIWIVFQARTYRTDRRQALQILLVFSVISALLWTYGVTQTSRLWQSRLLFPALFALAIPTALGIVSLEKLNLPGLRLSFVFSAVAAVALWALLLDFGLLVLSRNPLAVALGMESRQSYSARLQPEYTQAVALVNELAANAYVYLLDEPRSYGMNRRVQPDLYLDNLPHDLYLYKDNSKVVQSWRNDGYTHVLLARQALGVDDPARAASDPDFLARFSQLEHLLQEISATRGGEYVLYKIPEH